MPEDKNVPDGSIQSINEPPGSNVKPVVAETQPAKAAAKPQAAAGGRDPDELEEEIEAAEDDDDVDVKHGGKNKKKR